MAGLLAAGAATAVIAVWQEGLPWRRALPPLLRLEDVVRDLGATFEPAMVVRGPADAPVSVGSLQPSPDGEAAGGARRAIVTGTPSLLRFRLRVPPGAALDVAAGVAGDGKRDPDAAGVRFAIAVDGRTAWTTTVNPARSRHDRHWFDARVPLTADAEREVEVTLETAPAGAGRVAGAAGWGRPRIVRETWRARQTASPAAPNVLVLLVDTLRADTLGCYGAVPSASPTLDRLARHGLVFARTVAQSSWTLTSVASLFSGLYPRSHGVFGLPREAAVPAGFQAGGEWSYLAEAIPTLADQARRAGITTVGVSANPLVSRATNLAHGFETFEEIGGRYWPRADEVNGRFLAWLRLNRRHRFFGYLHYMDAHGPCAPPSALRPPAPRDPVRAAVAKGDIDHLARAVNQRTAGPLTVAETEYLHALYRADVRAWDADLATLLRGLRDLGVRDSTVVVVTADHGEEFQEHGRLGHGSQLYDETLLVPLVIAGPRVGRGRLGAQAQGIDLFPTVATLLGIPTPAGLPGRNLLAAPEDRPVLSETRYGIGPDGTPTEVLGLRTAEWKLVHMPALGRFELYDLRHDPGERHDRFADAPEGAALAARLAAWQAPPPPTGDGQDPALVEKLRALGYVD